MFGMCNSEAGGVGGYPALHQGSFVPESSFCPSAEGSSSDTRSNAENTHVGNAGHSPEGPFPGGGSTEQHSRLSAQTTKFEPSPVSLQSSPAVPGSGIVSDNGLQYANLDGSGGGGGGMAAAAAAAAAYGGGGQHHPVSAYQQHHHHSGLSHHAAVAAAYGHYSENSVVGHSTGGGGGGGGGALGTSNSGPATGSASSAPEAPFTAYLESSNSGPYVGSYSSIYGQPKLRQSEYPPYHVPKTASNVPTYKWMQVKRNVPKPGKNVLYCTQYDDNFCQPSGV